VLRLTIRVVPPEDACGNSSIRGTWRQAARVPRQAVWKPLSLATHVERQAIFDEADIVFCFRWMCVVYETLGDISRVRCWSIPGVVAQDGG